LKTILLAPIGAALLGWLAVDQCEEVCATPTLTSIEASVPEVQVTPAQVVTGADKTRRFRLSAWYRDAEQRIVVGYLRPEWAFTPEPDGSVDDQGGVTIGTFPGSNSAEATVKVRKPDDEKIFATVKLTRWHDVAAAVSAGDVIDLADQVQEADDPPRVALIEEDNWGTCIWGTPRAFVGAAAVGEQNSIPCSLTVLSADKAMFFEQGITDTKWTQKAQTFQPRPAAPRVVKITVFVAVSARTAAQLTNSARASPGLTSSVIADAMSQAAVDVATANTLFAANRVGIRVVAQYIQLAGTPEQLAADIGADPFDCYKPRQLTDPQGSPGYAHEPSTISVYYVDRIAYPKDPLYAGSRGVQCPFWYSGTEGPVIYVSYTRHSTVTLAHEIAHALGLNDEEEELGVLNVMYNLADDGPLGADARSQFTVGQVFTMNVWNWSYLIVGSAAPQRNCNQWDPCPGMSLDVR
jgi:hypothetical protein